MRKIVDIIGRLSFVLIFLIYALGFLIWQSYLSHYGIMHSDFLSVDFVSAAFCYLTLMITFSLPPALLLIAIEKPTSPIVDPKHTWVILMLWYFLMTGVMSLFFHEVNQISVPVLEVLFLIFAVHLLVWYRLRRLKKHPDFYQFLSGKRWLWAYFTLWALISVFISPAIDKWFVLSCLIFYASPTIMYGVGGVKGFYEEGSKAIGFLKVCVVGVLIIQNVYAFGGLQFGTIPKTVGGGKPEIALLYLSPEFTEAFAKCLDLPLHDQTVGPVAILLKSEHEITVVLPKEASAKGKFPARQIAASMVDGIRYLPEEIPK